MFDRELMRRAAAFSASNEQEFLEGRSFREEGIDELESLERTGHEVPNLTDEEVAGLISEEAKDLVIGFEVWDRAAYERKYVRPEWPGGASGITIGIGYDVGYHTSEEIARHWANLLSERVIEKLRGAVGLRGAQAKSRLSAFQDIEVPWDTALAAYRRSTMPKYGRLVLTAFPNAADLKGHAFGALFSLVFNRGASMRDNKPGDRQEMRDIRDAMGVPDFDRVPGAIRAMKRVWAGKNLPGLLKRRDSEALLFERGLELRRQYLAGGGAPLLADALAAQATGQASAFERVGPALDDAALDGENAYYEAFESDESQFERTGGEVKWPDQDTDSPDYQHIASLPAVGATFEFGPRELELLIAANAFEPTREHGRIMFGLRGAQLVTSATDPSPMFSQVDRLALSIRDARPNHQDFRCIIGVYDIATQRMSGFASSTVPNRKAVAGYFATKKAGNMMPTGCYRFTVNWHLASKPARKVPGCLVEAGRQKAVLRTVNNLSYDTEDIWENKPLHGDNLHPAFGDTSFSSLGCLTVRGNFSPGPGNNRAGGQHLGEWGLFRQVLGLAKSGTTDHGKEFDLVLLTGREGAIAHDFVKQGKEAAGTTALARLRQGSSGESVRRLQRGMTQPETGVFDHRITKLLVDLQKRDFAGRSDGIYSPTMDKHFKFGVFDVAPMVVASTSDGARLESIAVGKQARLDALYYEIGLEAELAKRGAGGSDRLESTHLEFSLASLKSLGASLTDDLERRLQSAICSDAADGLKAEVRSQIEAAAKMGGAELRKVFIRVLTNLAVVVPEGVVAKVVDVIIEKVLTPALGPISGPTGAAVDVSAVWLCTQWETRLGPLPGASARPALQPGPAPKALNGPASGFVTPSAQPALEPDAAELKLASLVDLIEKAAKNTDGETLDPHGVRRYMQDLGAELSTSSSALSAEQSRRLVAALCDHGFMEQMSGAVADPYAVMKRIADSLAETPPKKADARAFLQDLHVMLADARVPVRPEALGDLLKTLKDCRLFDELSWIADRLIARDPSLIGAVSVPYAQGLIDGGRIISAIEILHAAIDSKQMTPDQEAEADGILGRAHKQMYVNHVRTPAEAIAMRDTLGHQIVHAVASYGRRYHPSRPSENYYHGINYIACLKRAQRDRVPIDNAPDPDHLAKELVAALTPAADGPADPWILASIGEAHLALGDYKAAAEYLGRYAKCNETTAFMLSGTVRQFEEVWQLRAGTEGGDAILTGLKGALAVKENGFITLTHEEQRTLAKADSAEFQDKFESHVQGGSMSNFRMLKAIVTSGSSVVSIRNGAGASAATVGTGFLVHGPDLSPRLSADKSYVLTNAHVVWDPAAGQGVEDLALKPGDAQFVFESDHLDGIGEAFASAGVIWQSASTRHDATLIELDRKVERQRPLKLADETVPLVVSEKEGSGTRLAVIGHAGGRDLTIAVLGSIDKMHGTLVDRGPRGNTKDPIYLHYRTPTEGGNSGSPVFEVEGWRVVALHHAGFNEAQGRPKLGGKTGNNLANEGIDIRSIREAVRAELVSPKTGGGEPRRRRWYETKGRPTS